MAHLSEAFGTAGVEAYLGVSEMLGDWRHRHSREVSVLLLPIGALVTMLALVLLAAQNPI